MRKTYTSPLRALLVLFALIILSIPQTSLGEVALKDADIRHFIAAIKPLDKLGKKYALDQDKDMMSQTMDGEFNPMSQSLKRIRKHEAYGEFKHIIQKAGFSSDEEWAMVGDRVMKAFIALKMKKEMQHQPGQGGVGELEESLKQIENNQHISSEMKERLLKQIKQSIIMIKSVSNSSPADQNALRPHMDNLNTQFKDVE